MFQELWHYKENKEVLGNHPLFKKERIEQEAQVMTGVEVMKAYKNLAPRISRLKKKIANAKNEGTRETMQKQLRDLEVERRVYYNRIYKN